MKKTILTICLVAATIGVQAQSKAPTAQEQQELETKYTQNLLPAGTLAPDFVIKKAKSEDPMLSLSDYRTHKEGTLDRPGCYVLLDFWATWCPDCRREIPTLKDIYKKYKNQVKMIGVSFDTDKENLKDFTKKNEMKWTMYSEYKKWKETEISGLYKIQWLPTMYLIDPDGKVAYSTITSENMVKKLEELDQEGKLKEYFKTAEFPGGKEAWAKAISNIMKFPEIAQKYRAQAKVKVSFIVDENGNASDVEVKEYLGQSLSGKAFNALSPSEQKDAEIQVKTLLSQEAIRTVTYMAENFKFIPGQERGKNVKVKLTQTVRFHY